MTTPIFMWLRTTLVLLLRKMIKALRMIMKAASGVKLMMLLLSMMIKDAASSLFNKMEPLTIDTRDLVKLILILMI